MAPTRTWVLKQLGLKTGPTPMAMPAPLQRNPEPGFPAPESGMTPDPLLRRLSLISLEAALVGQIDQRVARDLHFPGEAGNSD